MEQQKQNTYTLGSPVHEQVLMILNRCDIDKSVRLSQAIFAHRAHTRYKDVEAWQITEWQYALSLTDDGTEITNPEPPRLAAKRLYDAMSPSTQTSVLAVINQIARDPKHKEISNWLMYPEDEDVSEDDEDFT